MSDLSTFAGQAEHYAAVRARLHSGTVPSEVTEVRRYGRVVTQEWPPKPRGPLPIIRTPKPLLPPGDDSPFMWNFIVASVAEKHGITVKELNSTRRSRHIVAARQEACWRLSRETSMSLPTIGRRIGGRDHTTVLHSIRRYAEREGITLGGAIRGKVRKIPVFTAEGWK